MKQRTEQKIRRVSLEDLKKDLAAFETKYGITSEDFYLKFQAGETGDSSDEIEWAGLYEWFRKDSTR